MSVHPCEPPIVADRQEDVWWCPECAAGWRLVASCDLAHPDNVLVTWQRTSWPARQPD
jgi:hypothetical protein